MLSALQAFSPHFWSDPDNMFTSITSLLLLGLASAIPTWSPIGGNPRPGQCTSDQLATFDDLVAVPAIPEVDPVGTYMGLSYNAFNVLEQGVAGIITAGITPQSGTQVASNGITDSVLDGVPAISPISPYKSFTLKSFYFGCVANSKPLFGILMVVID